MTTLTRSSQNFRPAKNDSDNTGEKIFMATSYSHLPMRKEAAHWNVSSAVLRNSSTFYSVPKDERFKQPKINYYNHYQLSYPSSLSNRGAAIGYGKKSPIPEVFAQKKNEATMGVPFYQVDDMKLRRNKSQVIKRGKTIGASWGTFTNARAPHRNTVHCSEQVKANPGHKYNVETKTGGEVPKSTIHARLRMFSDIRSYHKREEPGPQNYSIEENHTKRWGQKTNFGLGKKSDFTNNPELSSTPGPVYNLSGFTDKFKNIKMKNMGKSWK